MVVVRERRLVRLEREIDVHLARERAAEMALQAGFDIYQRSGVETAVSEVCTNALKYGERGWASLRLDEHRLSAVITDEGPGFGAASTHNPGLGVGLAGAERLMGELTIESLPRGSRVRIAKEVPNPGVGDGWIAEVAVRSRAGRERCGDRCWIGGDGDLLLAVVVDGLGSGAGAAEAAEAVTTAAARDIWDHPLDEVMKRADAVARSTRGAVGAMVRIRASAGTVEYVSVGDVSGVLGPSDEPLEAQPGVIGVEMPEVQVRRLEWADSMRLALWTDGVHLPRSGGFDPPKETLGDWVETTVIEQGTERDDGLLLVAERHPVAEPDRP